MGTLSSRTIVQHHSSKGRPTRQPGRSRRANITFGSHLESAVWAVGRDKAAKTRTQPTARASRALSFY